MASFLVKISQLFSGKFSSDQAIQLKQVFEALKHDLDLAVADNAVLRASIVAITAKLDVDTAAQNVIVQALNDAFDTAMVKLNNDAGVTDADYASASQTSSWDEDYADEDPAASTFIATANHLAD